MALYFPVGLPGSGKTEHFKELSAYSKIKYIDSDKMFLKGKSLNEVLIVTEKIINMHKQDVYLDGLFLSEKVQEEIIDFFYGKVPIYIQLFNSTPEDRKNCIYNDKLRDRGSSENIIQNAKVHIPDHRDGIDVRTMDVPAWNFIETLLKKDYVDYKSENFTLSGSTYGSCWDENGPTDMNSDEDEIENFTLVDIEGFNYILKELDLTYEKIEPNIHFYDRLVEKIEDAESDYYGGCEYFVYFQFNPKEMLKEILLREFNITTYNTKDIEQIIPELFI